MRKSAMPRRTRPIGRSAPVKRRNVARADANWTRAYHSRERVEFVNESSCVVCGYPRSDNAHTANGGKSRKGGYKTILNLCGVKISGGALVDGCHQKYEGRRDVLEAALRAKTGHGISYHCAALERAWREFSGETMSDRTGPRVSEQARKLVTNHEMVAMAIDTLGATELGDAEEMVLEFIAGLEAEVTRLRAALADVGSTAMATYENEHGVYVIRIPPATWQAVREIVRPAAARTASGEPR